MIHAFLGALSTGNYDYVSISGSSARECVINQRRNWRQKLCYSSGGKQARILTGRILEIEHEVHVCLLPFECVCRISRVLLPHRVPLVPTDLKDRRLLTSRARAFLIGELCPRFHRNVPDINAFATADSRQNVIALNVSLTSQTYHARLRFL